MQMHSCMGMEKKHHYLHAFSLKAHVDWLDLEILFSKKSQFRHVQKAIETHTGLGKLHVTSIDGSNTTTDAFVMRIHDPLLRPLQDALSRLSAEFSQILRIKVTGLEVAIDLIPKLYDNFSHQKMAAAAFELTRNLAYRHTEQPDIITYPKGFYEVTSREHALQGLMQRLVLRTGRARHKIRHRAYIKTTNSVRAGTAIPVQPCARFEVTLVKEAVPVTAFEELSTFNFASLIHHFRQVRLTPLQPSATKIEHQKYEELAQGHAPLGTVVSKAKKARAEHKRISKCDTQRDMHANQLLTGALRTLTRRFANCVTQPTKERVALPESTVDIALPHIGKSVISKEKPTLSTHQIATSPNYGVYSTPTPSENSTPGWGTW